MRGMQLDVKMMAPMTMRGETNKRPIYRLSGRSRMVQVRQDCEISTWQLAFDVTGYHRSMWHWSRTPHPLERSMFHCHCAQDQDKGRMRRKR